MRKANGWGFLEGKKLEEKKQRDLLMEIME